MATETRAKRAAAWSGSLAAALALILASYFVVAAVMGAARWSHPIPYWDMWDGYLSFWFELGDGNTAIWWELSNEHHLVLLKAIFWVDLTVFNGSHVFLVAVNLILVALTAATLVLLLVERLRDSRSSLRPLSGLILISAVVVVLPFAWMQGEDLVFPYHAQFLMNNVAPLASFVLIGMSARRFGLGERSATWLLWLGIVLVILSPWTSASGLLVPFVAAALVWAIGMGWRWTLMLIGVGVVSFIVYSIDSPFLGSGDGGAITNLTSQPLEVLRFWLLYLGRPWSHVTGEAWIGGVAGTSFVLITVVYVVRMMTSNERSISGLTTAAFPVYMLATAGITAAGRVSFGMEQVQAIRYLTPMLVAWACLVILAAPSIQNWIAQGASMILLAMLVIPLVLLPEQASALRTPDSRIHERDTATLAVALNALDPVAIGAVYPISPDRPLMLGQRAIAEGIGVLGGSPYRDLADRVGQSGPFAPATTCFGWVDSRTPLEGSNWDRIDGWVIAEGHATDSGVFTLTDQTGAIVGFITGGKSRPDVLNEFPDSSGLNGYSGYLDRSTPAANVFVADEAFRCSNPLTPAVP